MTATIVAGFACAVPGLASQRTATSPEVAGASFFAVSVADLEASQAWYGRAVGVETVRSIESRDGQSRGSRSTPRGESLSAPSDGAFSAPAAASSESRARRRQQSLAVLAERIRAAAESPGAILGLRFPEGETTVAAAGVADLASSRPLDAGDAYFLGSISKTYTAAVVMRLVEDGRLSLDDSLSRFLPSFPRADAITVAQLLEHRTGLRDFYSYLYFRPD